MGNNPIHEFSGESTPGTEIQIGSGQYNVTEQGLDPNTSGYKLCQVKGFDAGREFGTNLFICTNFSDGCEGNITLGSPQTCTITNVLVLCEVTVDTIIGVGISGTDSLRDIAYDPIHERMYVATRQ